MNTSDLTYLLNKPEATNEKQTIALESVVLQFPYFQAARALHLKGLYNQDSFRYNYELKKTAAYTTDRTVLFEFITSESFMAIQQEKIDEIHKSIKEIEVYFEEELDSSSIKKSENLDLDVSEEIIKTPTNEIDVLYKKSLETLFLSAEHLIEETKEETEIEEISVQQKNINPIQNQTEIDEKLEIGKPLPFTPSEKHSFQEWLQLTKSTPIDRNFEENNAEIDVEKQKKLAIIDKFIEANPKIAPVKETSKTPVNISKIAEEPTHLMTETLAKVYLEQKKYTKAIQAYEILILKYPEKSSFFATRINEIKNLQQNNN
jgi:hypothetical protein